MRVTRLTLHGFTVFHDAEFVFAPGVNVLIGENGTGKSHVLKLVYALTEAARRFAAGEGDVGALVHTKLLEVFQPDGQESFVSSSGGRAIIGLEWEDARIDVEIGPGNAFSVGVPSKVRSPDRESRFVHPATGAPLDISRVRGGMAQQRVRLRLDVLRPLRGARPEAVADGAAAFPPRTPRASPRRERRHEGGTLLRSVPRGRHGSARWSPKATASSR